MILKCNKQSIINIIITSLCLLGTSCSEEPNQVERNLESQNQIPITVTPIPTQVKVATIIDIKPSQNEPVHSSSLIYEIVVKDNKTEIESINNEFIKLYKFSIERYVVKKNTINPIKENTICLVKILLVSNSIDSIELNNVNHEITLNNIN